MKLHHFIAKKDTDDVQRLRSIGKTIVAPVEQPAQVTEAVKKVNTKKIEVADTDDVDHKKHQVAVAQLEAGEHHQHSRMALKIKNYD